MSVLDTCDVCGTPCATCDQYGRTGRHADCQDAMDALGLAWQWVEAEQDRVEGAEWRGDARVLALAEGRLQRAERELVAVRAYVRKVAARHQAEQGVPV